MNRYQIFTIASIFLLLHSWSLSAQKYFTKSGKIHFFSETPMENIEAENNTVTSVLDVESGRMEFAVLIKAFHFEKALMEEHFNENYLESGKFPKAVFKGQITNLDAVDFSKAGEQEVVVSGDLTIHGETNPVSAVGKLTKTEEGYDTEASFTVLLSDYKVEIPSVVKDNISNEIKIDVAISYKPLN